MALEIAAPRLDRAELLVALADLDRFGAAHAAALTDDERQAVADAFLDVDRAFHRLLAERAGNSRLTAAAEGLWAQIAVFQQAGARRGWTDLAIRHHRAIIAASLDGDAVGPVASLKHHIGEVKRLVLDELARGRTDPVGANGRTRRDEAGAVVGVAKGDAA
jgi:DNA-binding GntR family transcriptional regulator